jgi:hypothetical protein
MYSADEIRNIGISIWPYAIIIASVSNGKDYHLVITPDQYTDLDSAIDDIVLKIKKVAPEQWLKKYNKRIAEERDFKIDEILAD